MVIATAVLYAYAYLLPQDFGPSGTAYLLLATLAFFLGVFQFHAALAMGGLLLLALALRAWRLAGAAAVVGGLLFLPTLRPMLTPGPPAGTVPAVRVMSMNLYFRNTTTWKISDEVRRADPDVIVMVEFTPKHAADLAKTFGRDYPYRRLRPMTGSGGIGIYSRLPLRPDALSHDVPPWEVRALLTLAGRDVVLQAVHLNSPGSFWAVAENRAQTAELVARSRGETRPAIVAGDFNFDETTPNFAALREAGFVAAHDIAGETRGATWPARSPLKYLPGIRIDHLLLRDGTDAGLTCTRAWVGGFDGSDHLPIVADVAIRPLAASQR